MVDTPPIIERPIPRVENMAEFYNPTRPSHFRNGSLIRKRRVYSPHELRSARTVGGTVGLNQGPAYFTRCRSSPNRRPRSYSRSYSRSPSKTPERRRSCSKSPSRSPVRCPLVLGHVQNQGLLLMLEVDLSPLLIAGHPPNMSLTYQYGKDKLTCSLIIRDISLGMLYRDLGACLI